MENARDSLIDLERHRRRLEENINELQRVLQHWRTWDAEYEALKEEVEAASDSSPAELKRIQDEFEGELVNKKEVGEIFGKEGRRRSREQIVNVLDRRIDYVSKNIGTLQKQLETAESKHATASIVSQPDIMDDEGQPITEIVEHLDDDDNIVSYKLNRPGESMSHIREALEKAGIKDLPPVDGDSSNRQVAEVASDDGGEGPKEVPTPLPTNVSRPPMDSTAGKAPEKTVQAPKKKKGVSFTNDTKLALEEERDVQPVSQAARRVENIMKSAEGQGDIMKQKPVIPEDEDEDDAALRQEMLKYSMGDFGAVVAELDIEEGTSDMEDDWDSDEGFGEGEDGDEDDDEEDKYGRSTLRVVTDSYRQRMLELEQRLGVNSNSAAKQKINDEANMNSDSDDERIGRIVVKPESSLPSKPTSSSSQIALPERPTTKQASKKSEKKGVRFAQNLDIAPDTPPSAAAKMAQVEVAPAIEPHGDVMERSVSEKKSTVRGTKAAPPKRASRFKKALEKSSDPPKGPMDIPASFVGENRPVAPSGPPSATIADKLVERDIVSRPIDSNEFDDFGDMDAIAHEHQRLRKKFIQRQGGFLKEDESPIQPLDETEGGPVRPSRFKAARLSRY
ncbi:hypothetical protein GMORB2_3922 [Geosmithia morbida]|uniref:DUF3835 domain-containing protein n=1 Tax=Geosmithia morbida TaxID=1094350 RepID=A0A9P4Z0L3_9HYPO|nr:uncharacterized protein GMORB2_3922 [Geosmithia morbida]KAF4125083.1 hypothetical protein GMORB2_3922 [Geosmithia morbida]